MEGGTDERRNGLGPNALVYCGIGSNKPKAFSTGLIAIVHRYE